VTTVHQVVPVLARADAVGAHTLLARDAFRAAGWSSEVFAEDLHDDVRREARPVHHLDRAGPADLLLYQCSTGTALTSWLLDRPEPLAVEYHNITPAPYFERWEPEAARNMRRARADLARLAPRTALAIADSSFNAAELAEAGFPPAAVVPPLVDLGAVAARPHRATAEALRRARRGAHWLFVGRLAPNKCQHDVIAALAAARRLGLDPGARLTLVGSTTSDGYRDALAALADDLGVAGAVTFTDRIGTAQLAAHWADADVFVCLSEHEGFCVPVVEAMQAGVPVVAHAAGAVPETVGPAGVLLDDKDPVLVAVAVTRLLADPVRRGELVDSGKARAAELGAEVVAPRLVEVVRRFLEGGARGG
jgi:glycosyltransferase involved in cell wall biosynthesis